MTAVRDIYKCDICGNVVEIINEGAPSLVCCGQSMVRLEAKALDQGQEKHVPVIEVSGSGIKVKVGEVAHPMEDKHYIKMIEVLTASKVLRAELKPGNTPSAEFCVSKDEIITVREYCTVHGLWKNN